MASDGTVAEAAYPVEYQGQVGAVIVYSDPVSDIVRSVAIVRHEILVAGGIALLLALIVGYFVARALSRAGQAARARRRAGGGRRLRPSDRRWTRPTSSGSWRSPSTRCSASSGSSRRPARSSSRPPRTSCARRSSRSAGSSSCSRTRTSTRRRGAGSSTRCREQVERLRKLSVDLLDLSRLESGSLELRPEQVDLGELTRSVSGEFEPTLAQHDSHLELRLPSRTIEAVCDPVRVAQIMRILIDNALTHTSSGTRIVVTAGREDGTRPPGRTRRRRGDRPGIAVADLRAVLHRRRRPGVGPRPGDRLRARRADGRAPVGRVRDRETRRSPWSCRSMAAGRPCTRPAARRRRRGSRHERPVSWPMTTTTGPELVLELGQQLRERVLPELGSHAGRAHAGDAAGGDVTFAVDEIAEELLAQFVAERAPAAGVLLRGPRPGGAARRHRRAGRRPDRRHPPGDGRAGVGVRRDRAGPARRRRADDGGRAAGLRGRDQDRRLVPGREGRRRAQHATGRAEPDHRHAADVLGLRVPRAAGAAPRSRCWPS